MHDEMHSATCPKGPVGRATGCRFGFPRPLVDKTFITEDGRIKAARNDPWINCYNPAVLLNLRCNHDIRFLLSGPDAHAAMHYTGDYISKAAVKLLNKATCLEVAIRKVEKLERSGRDFGSAVERARQMVIRSLNQLTGHSEKNGPEIAHQLLGHPLAYKSHTFVNLVISQFLRFVDRTDPSRPTPGAQPPAADPEGDADMPDPDVLEARAENASYERKHAKRSTTPLQPMSDEPEKSVDERKSEKRNDSPLQFMSDEPVHSTDERKCEKRSDSSLQPMSDEPDLDLDASVQPASHTNPLSFAASMSLQPDLDSESIATSSLAGNDGDMPEDVVTLEDEEEDYPLDDSDIVLPRVSEDDPDAGDDVIFSRPVKGLNPVLHCQRWDYCYRPADLETECLYSFFASYQKLPVTSRANAADSYSLAKTRHRCRTSHHIVGRMKPRVPVLLGGRIPNAKTQPELNAKMKLLLFKPFRSGQDLRSPGQSWIDALLEYQKHPDTKDKVCRWMSNVDALHEGESQVARERAERREADEAEKLAGGGKKRQRPESDYEESDEGPFAYDGENDFPDVMYGHVDQPGSPDYAISPKLTSQFMRNLAFSVTAVGKSDAETAYAKSVVLALHSAGFTHPSEEALKRCRALTVESHHSEMRVKLPPSRMHRTLDNQQVPARPTALDLTSWQNRMKKWSQEVCCFYQ